jgi:hypothetical protein
MGVYTRGGNIWVRVLSWSKRAKNPIWLKRGQKSPKTATLLQRR